MFLTIITIFSSSLFAGELKHELISGRLGQVEIFHERPEGNGPFPALILIHGHQGGRKIGAESIAKSGYFPQIIKKGFVAIAVSQSGYGQTSGLPDNCGENSQNAVKAAIIFARKQKFIDGNKIALIGHSMGASLAAIIASHDEKLAGVILSSGIYDQEKALLKLDFYSRYNRGMESLYDELQKESGNHTDRFVIRSALLQRKKIKAPVLLLSGLGDQIAQPEQSLRLHESIQSSGGKSRLVIFPFAGHNIRPAQSAPEMNQFLEENLR